MPNLRLMMAEAIDAISPIKLFQREQMSKLGSELAGRGMPTVPGYADRIRGLSGRGTMDMLSDYWNGMHLDDIRGPVHGTGQSVMYPSSMVRRTSDMTSYYNQVAKNKAIRRGAAYVAGGTVASGLVFGDDSLPTSAGRTAVKGGMYGAGLFGVNELGHAKGMPNLGRYTAYGLGGLSALNMFRQGDQLGPF